MAEMLSTQSKTRLILEEFRKKSNYRKEKSLEALLMNSNELSLDDRELETIVIGLVASGDLVQTEPGIYYFNHGFREKKH